MAKNKLQNPERKLKQQIDANNLLSDRLRETRNSAAKTIGQARVQLLMQQKRILELEAKVADLEAGVLSELS